MRDPLQEKIEKVRFGVKAALDDGPRAITRRRLELSLYALDALAREVGQAAAPPSTMRDPLQALIEKWRSERWTPEHPDLTDLSTWGCLRYSEALERCVKELEAVLGQAAAPPGAQQQESATMTVPVRTVGLIEARNHLRDALVKLRGGHAAASDDGDVALAELDIAIGKVGMSAPGAPLALQAVELIREVYQSHRDQDSAETDWQYPNYDPEQGLLADVPCDWCVSAKQILEAPGAPLEHWHPIETAPLTGHILATTGHLCFVVRWDDVGRRWRQGSMVIYPKYWMPLPAAPASPPEADGK